MAFATDARSKLAWIGSLASGALGPLASALLVSAIMLPLPIAAEQPAGADAGVAALLSQDYDQAYRLLIQAAEQGDAQAALALASAYRVGLGAPADFAAAAQWTKAAADAGWPDGLRLHGLLLLAGQGAPADPRGAAELFAKAADKGDAWSRYLLGRLLESGAPGVPADLEAAARSYELAAAQRLPYAAWRLGELLIAGKGVAPDVVRGVAQLRKAAEAGVVPAQAALARQLFKGEGVVQNYGEAFDRYLDAAMLGDAHAQNMVGFMLQKGVGAKADLGKAFAFYERAAANGHAQALYNIALLFRDGHGVKPSAAIAHAFFNLAAARGLPDAGVQRRQMEPKLDRDTVLKAQRFAADWRTDWPLAEMKVVSTGSGFFVSLGGALVTNHHVVHGCDGVGVRIGDDIRRADVVFAVEPQDLALVQLRPEQGRMSRFGVARIAAQDEAFLGERLIVFGWPLTGRLSADGVLTSGTLSAWTGLYNDADFLQMSAPIQPGNSGGAVLGETGLVVGVVSYTYTGGKSATVVPQNVNFAVKSATLLRLLDRHAQPYYSKAEGEGKPLSTRELAALGKNVSAQMICYAFKLDK